MSEPHAIADAAVRMRALDPTASFIVQAPAGSGKTELLIQRYLQLLATVQQPEQILAITFTRKAAAEMHARVLQALAVAEEPAPSSPHKRITWQLAQSVRNADAKYGWNLRQHANRLRIQTIDALSSMLARRLPVLSGAGAGLTPAEQPESLYRAAVEQLMQRLADDAEIAAHLERLLVHLGHGVERLADLLVDLLRKRDQWLAAVLTARRSPDLRTSMEATLGSLVQQHLAKLCGALGERQRAELWKVSQWGAETLLVDGKLSPARREALSWAATSNAIPNAEASALRAWRVLVDAFCTQEGPLYKTLNKRNGFPTTDARKPLALRALERLRADPTLAGLLAGVRELPGVTYSDAQWQVLESLLVVLPLAVAELQLVFQAQRQADYVEIAQRALRALGPPEEPTDLALAFDGRLDHLLVDEFQDTSLAQLELLERLTEGWTAGDGRTLFCVGDPMQSIYRFRQAEVGLFLDMQRNGLPNVRLEPLRLSANFRASRPLVDWINRVMPAVLAPEDDVTAGAVKYSPCVAALTSNEGGVSVHPLATTALRPEALEVVSIVRAALAEDVEGSVAILVTAKHHASAICAELTRAQIAFTAVEIAQLGEQSVVQDLVALTRALVHLGDRTAWLALLRAPWCGMTLEDLHALVGEQLQGVTIYQQLTSCVAEPGRLSLHGQRRAQRVHAILQVALQERGRYALRDWVERTWNSLGGPATLHQEQELSDAEAFLARLEELEQAGDLEDVARLPDDLTTLFAKPQRQVGARVEVMTIHKAKGLEFDTVILPGLHRPTRGTDTELLRWTRMRAQHGRHGLVMAPSQGRGADADPVYRWLHLLEQQRALAERSRLLYVAGTRARRNLHLLGYAHESKGEGTPERKPHARSMLQLLWHEVASAFQALPQPANPEPVAAARVPVQRLPIDWEQPTADAPVLLRIGHNPDSTAERLPFDWASETARHVGTLVHRELERMTRGAAALTANRRVPLQRYALELAELGVPAERRAEAGRRVGDAIERTLLDARGRWLLGLDRNITAAQSELGLSGMVNGRLVNAVIDRTFIDAHGTRWIVDFKTSTHEGGGLEQFLSEEVVRYRTQLTLYAELMQAMEPAQPVRAALYFPLLQQWREVV